MITETTSRNPFKTGHLSAPASPPTRLRLEQVRWCPRCRRYRGPDGRLLPFETVRRLSAAHQAEARRIEAEQAVVLTFGPKVSEARARQSAATLFGTPALVIRPPVTTTQARTARTAAILFDSPMPTTPWRPNRAEARAARTAQLPQPQERKIMTTAATPAQLYLAGLSEGSQGMRQSLDIIAAILNDDHDSDSFPWQEVTYRESMAVRIALTERYKPSTVNKMLSALRGVLKQTWRLGLIDADAYRRAADVENIRVSDLLSGRALEGDEITQLFATCAADPTPKGARDAAMLAVFYGCGLRRGELARLDVGDFDPDDGSIVVHGKRRKQRTVYLTDDGAVMSRRGSVSAATRRGRSSAR